MRAEDIPFFVALIFPGFFAIQTFSWATHGRKMSDVMRILLSFLYTVPIFFGLHAFLRHLVRVPSSDLPSPETIAKNAADAPVWFLVGLYLAGALAGYLIGLIWRTQSLDTFLRVFGLDVRRHRDLLSQALGQRAYVDIKLKDGTLFRGWPFMFNAEEDADRFVYLVRASQKDSQGGWKKKTSEVLIPVERIERIYFLNPQRPLLRRAEDLSRRATAEGLTSRVTHSLSSLLYQVSHRTPKQ